MRYLKTSEAAALRDALQEGLSISSQPVRCRSRSTGAVTSACGTKYEERGDQAVDAARGDECPSQVVVRPSNTHDVRLRARLASCGPPRAALLVFET